MTGGAAASEFHYAGDELALFGKAAGWKQYWRSLIEPYVRGNVLEVGAGIGSNAELLRSLPHGRWTCLEPDAQLAARIPACPARNVIVGKIAGVAQTFDTILYADVLEHIEDDLAELSRAALCLRPGGCLIILAPAHAFLYSLTDASVGHFRRYSSETLRATAPRAFNLETMKYVDSVGLLASLANRFVLKQSTPTEGQILAWDRLMIPASRALDRALGYRVGKSVLAVWRCPP